MATNFVQLTEKNQLRPFVPEWQDTKQTQFDVAWEGFTQPISRPEPTPTSTPISPPDIFEQALSIAEQKKTQQRAMLEQTRQKIEASQKQQSSFWPTFLSVAAALSGNFGPAIQLQEQKRKTALAKDVFPHMIQINDLTRQGDFEGANALAQTVGASFGTRSPELAGFFQQVQKQIADKQQNLHNMKLYVESKLATYPEGHPDLKRIKVLKKFVDSNVPASEELFKTMDQSARLHIQNMGGQTLLTSPETGQTLAQPYPEAAETKDVRNFAGLTVGQAYGLDVPQLVNLKRGLPVTDARGNVIQPGSPEARKIQQDLVSTQEITAQLEYIAPLVPIEPVGAMQLLTKLKPEVIAMRDVGPHVKDAIQAHIDRLTQQAVTIEKAKIDIDPRIAQQAGFIYWNADKNSPEFRRPVYATQAEALASGGKIQFAPRDAYMDKMIPAFKARDAFDLLPDLFDEINKTVGWQGRISAGIKQRVQNTFGVALEEGQEVGQAIRMIVNRAVEEVGKTMNINDPEVGRMKELLTSGLANPVEAIRAVNKLKDRLDDELIIYGGKQATDQPAVRRPSGQRPSKTGRSADTEAVPAAEYKRETERLRQLEQGKVPLPALQQQQQQTDQQKVQQRKGRTTFGAW